MHDFSINDVHFRRAETNRCRVIVHGQTVGDVQRIPDPSDPEGPEALHYRIHLYDGSDGPCIVHGRGQIRLAIADWLWNDGIVPDPLPPALAGATIQPPLPHLR